MTTHSRLSASRKKATRVYLQDFSSSLQVKLLCSPSHRRRVALLHSKERNVTELSFPQATTDRDRDTKRQRRRRLVSGHAPASSHNPAPGLSEASALLILLTEIEQDQMRRALDSLAPAEGWDERSGLHGLLEVGLAFALYPERVVFLDLAGLQTAGDHCGIHLICLDGALEKLLCLKTRLGSLHPTRDFVSGIQEQQTPSATLQ